ncbi:MAG: penicillin-binding protein 2 [Patescibacteria group bacterium]
MSIFNPFKNYGEIQGQEADYYLDIAPSELANHRVKRKQDSKKNYWVFNLFIFIAGGILIFRLLNLQIVEGFQNQLLAQKNQIRSRLVEAPRGLIYDAKGNKLVQNIADFEIVLKATDLPRKKEEKDKMLQQISEIFEINIDDLNTKVGAKITTNEPIVLKDNVTHDEALAFELKIVDLPSVSVKPKSIRKYITEGAFSHLLGYVGRINQDEINSNPSYLSTDVFGKTGLEKIYELNLSGKKGIEKIEVDSSGKYQRTLSSIASSPGNNLVLSLDLYLQKEAERLLREKMKEVDSAKGVVIAMNPQNGAILSMVSLPAYDNNLFATGISTEDYQKIKDDKDMPMINRAISGLYPSGSVIKPMIAAAALNEGVVTESTTIVDTGSISIGEWVFPDWKVHGLVDIKKAIAESCDVFFYAIGGGWDKIKGLGVAKIKEYLEKYGFGTPTGVDLPGENAGLVPDNDWKKSRLNESWYVGDTYHLSIGQGDFLTNPLQVITAISAVANGGKLYTPELVDKITDYNGKTIEDIEPKLVRENFISSENIEIVRAGMRQAVTDGSAKQLQDLPFETAAKTGTAQFGDKTKDHAWFVAFAPYQNPEIALVVMIEGGGQGSAVSQPIAKDLLSYYFTHKTQ